MSKEEGTLSMVEAREQLTRLPEIFDKEPEKHSRPNVIKVTRRNIPVLAILPWNLYESIIETLEILGDEELMISLHQSSQEAMEGEGKPWRTVKRELGWENSNETHPSPRNKRKQKA